MIICQQNFYLLKYKKYKNNLFKDFKNINNFGKNLNKAFKINLKISKV